MKMNEQLIILFLLIHVAQLYNRFNPSNGGEKHISANGAVIKAKTRILHLSRAANFFFLLR